jgi:selenium metabolism protein YedF
MSINLDARGLACPRPVIATKKALEGIEDGVVMILVDNMAAKENVAKFAIANQCEVVVDEKDGVYSIKIIKGQGKGEEKLPQTPSQDDSVFLITQKTLGHGSSELGEVLIKSFFYALLEKEPLPRTIMFINGGVYLTTENSPVLEHIVSLSAKGVQILSCGTCLDYYELKDKLAVGGITNMYSIIEEFSAAAKAITL